MVDVALAIVTSLAVLAVMSFWQRDVLNALSMSAVVGLSVGMGFACSSDFLLLTATQYLICVNFMRRYRSFVQARWLDLSFPLLVTQNSSIKNHIPRLQDEY